MLATIEPKDPQVPEGAQLVHGVTEAPRNFKGSRRGRIDLGNRSTSGKSQRLSKRGVELHLTACVLARPGRDGGESLFDPAAALLHQ
jgi:hypothetical protein